MDTVSAEERGHARTHTHTHTHTSIQRNKFILSEFIKNMPSYGLKSASLSCTNASNRQLFQYQTQFQNLFSLYVFAGTLAKQVCKATVTFLISAHWPFFFDVTTSNVSFLRGSNTQLRDVTAGPFTAGPLSDVTPLQCTADPTPEPHGRTRSRGPSHSF